MTLLLGLVLEYTYLVFLVRRELNVSEVHKIMNLKYF
jgi:hypothetical protein